MKRRMRYKDATERRAGIRFPVQLQLSYMLLEHGRFAHHGVGYTVDMSSGGVAFVPDRPLTPGVVIELSIGWPALENERRVRLAIFGCVLRTYGARAVCRVEKHEFRTESHAQLGMPSGKGLQLQRWAFARGLRPVPAG